VALLGVQRAFIPFMTPQLEQVWVTFLNSEMHKGMRQQPRKHPRMHMMKQII